MGKFSKRESKIQTSLFIAMLFFIIMGAVIIFLFKFQPAIVIGIMLVVFALIYMQAPAFFILLREYERAVILHFGKFKKIVGPGWVFLIPFVETYKMVDLRTHTVDIPAQQVLSKDNIRLDIDAVLFLKVEDPEKAILKVTDYDNASKTLIQASLRSVIGTMEASEVISHISKINNLLIESAKSAPEKWGVLIEKVEIQSISLPAGVQKSMHDLKEAEQKKFAAKQFAEGTKIKLNAVQEAASKFSDSTIQYMYLQSLQKIAEGKSAKLIFPMELSKLANAVSDKMGKNFSKVQDEVVEKYKEKTAAGEKPDEIIDELKAEYGLEDIELSEAEKQLAKMLLGSKATEKKAKKKPVKKKTAKKK